MTTKLIRNSTAEFLIFTGQSGEQSIEARYEEAVIRKFRITASDGKNYNTQHYNLDAIISVGYRVNSVRATQFRQWATQVLREFSPEEYFSQTKLLSMLIEAWFIERFLQFWGFVTIDPKQKISRELALGKAKIQPLFKDTFQFNIQ